MLIHSKYKFLSLSTFILLITANFWLLPVLFPFENAHGNSSSIVVDIMNRFGKRERIQIGEHENIDLVIRYLDHKGYKRIIKDPDASFIKVHIESLDLLPGDYVTLTDPLHQQEYTYPGISDFTIDDGPGFWALTIFGDTVEIELHTRYSDEQLRNLDISSYIVSIDKFARGFSMNKIQDFSYLPESVCGSDERRDAACYRDSHPEEFAKSNAVAMHVYNGLGWCSAWRVGPGNHMFTNEHCITNQAELNASEFWFGHQRLVCGSGSTQLPKIVIGKTLLEDDYMKDFALFTINESNLIGDFGWLEIDDRLPIQDEEIYIPQHPGGLSPDDQRKVIAVSSDMNKESVCRIDDPISDGRWLNTDTGYMCDTSPGASGSPVLARSSNAVLSMHHLGGCRNQGVRMNQIWSMVSEHLTPAPDLTTVSIPERAEVSSAFPVLIEAQNNNAPSPEGIINVSLSYSDDSQNFTITDLSAAWADRLQLNEPGQGLLVDKDCQEITGGAVNHVIEATDLHWEEGERHQLSFYVTPHQEGTLWLRVRNTMKDVRAGCNYYNDVSLTTDGDVIDTTQGGWDVIRLEIEVKHAASLGRNSVNNPSPADGSMDVPIDSILSWDLEGTDTVDQISYDVYMSEDESAIESLKCLNSRVPVCDPDVLNYRTNYNWYVTATDKNGSSIRGESWSFKTQDKNEALNHYLPFVFSNQ